MIAYFEIKINRTKISKFLILLKNSGFCLLNIPTYAPNTKNKNQHDEMNISYWSLNMT